MPREVLAERRPSTPTNLEAGHRRSCEGTEKKRVEDEKAIETKIGGRIPG